MLYIQNSTVIDFLKFIIIAILISPQKVWNDREVSKRMKKYSIFLAFVWAAAYCHVCNGGDTKSATDSSSEEASEASHSSLNLFGSLVSIDVVQGTVAIFIIVFAVLLVEKIFHGLHSITHDTPFQDMVSAIEKELMIVGCMAFAFKIIINTTSFLDASWLHALEYAGSLWSPLPDHFFLSYFLCFICKLDLVIPIVSFCFCGQGLFLILMSIYQCNIWSKAFHLHLEEIMDEYFNAISDEK